MRLVSRMLLVGLCLATSGCGDASPDPPLASDLPLYAGASLRESQYAGAVTHGRILYLLVAGAPGDDPGAMQLHERNLLAGEGWEFDKPGHELPMNRETAEAHSPDGQLFLTMTGKQCDQMGAPQPLAGHASAAIAAGDPILCVTLARASGA